MFCRRRPFFIQTEIGPHGPEKVALYTAVTDTFRTVTEVRVLFYGMFSILARKRHGFGMYFQSEFEVNCGWFSLSIIIIIANGDYFVS